MSILKFLPGALRLIVAIVLPLAILSMARASTVWTGPTISYSQPAPDPTQPANQDRLTDHVWITRGLTAGIFNASTETTYTHYFSPADTEWADGTTANYASLSYTNWEAWARDLHGGPPNTIGVNAVVHLISENIYLDIQFTSWGMQSAGGFSYIRSTPTVAPPPPTVTLTNPVNGVVYAAPAAVKLAADASVSSGAVTNVEFFVNGTAAGAVQAAPFMLTTGNLPAGPYALTAVAAAAGISATSAVVNVSVVNPVAVNLSAPINAGGQFSFSYSANAGLGYVIQRSTNLIDWIPLATNTADGSSVSFSNALSPVGPMFYRVGRLPNP